jgi:Formyltetrahydrofolate hydrolase
MAQDAGQYYDYDQRNLPNNPTNYPMQENTAMTKENKHLKELGEKYLNHYVTGHLKDGRIIEGIILGVDHESVTILVVEKSTMSRDDDSRQFGRFPGFFRFTPFRFPFPFFGSPFFTPFIFPFFWI